MTPDFLQINKFADLDNGHTIIFCKTDYLSDQFKVLRKLKHQVILISGNSDIEITSSAAAALPNNVVAWYCQNKLCYHPRMFCIPIGIENTEPPQKKRYGVAWEHAKEKVSLLTQVMQQPQKLPSNLVYANFNVSTNPKQRSTLKDICTISSHINWEEPNLNYSDFIDSVLKHEAVLCPAGNGIDTHRLYEILYCGRIAVTIRTGNYAIYDELYSQLPIITLEDPSELADYHRISSLIKAAKEKAFNYNLLGFKHWEKLVTQSAKTISPPNPSFFKRWFAPNGKH